jgi:hypothetical protein
LPFINISLIHSFEWLNTSISTGCAKVNVDITVSSAGLPSKDFQPISNNLFYDIGKGFENIGVAGSLGAEWVTGQIDAKQNYD